MSSLPRPVLIGGAWRPSQGARTFQAFNPRTTEPLPDFYPVSPWPEIEKAIHSAAAAFEQASRAGPEPLAAFLERYADRMEARRAELVEMAAQETALAAEPRLNTVELPRTVAQMRQGAAAARERSWSMPTIDAAANIRSMLQAIGPVCVFGPNNFPFAFNSVAGGDFVAAIAAGNPVIAKANSSHPGTTRVFAEEALEAARETGNPPALVQLIYRTDHQDGERLVSHPKIGATGYTGSRSAGLALKAAADAAGKPIYLELSSINPVVVLPGALKERAQALAQELRTSCLLGTGQFCTSPGLILLLQSEWTEGFVKSVSDEFKAAPVGTLLSRGVQQSLAESVAELQRAGANLVAGGQRDGGAGFSYQNTVLVTTGSNFLRQSEALQREAFGNSTLFVISETSAQLLEVIGALEGNLTGCVYSHSAGDDEPLYDQVEPRLRRKVGRLLNDKMPTGVAVSPAMNHGGPFPATGHPGFTAVGIPASLRRFAVLTCYDSVRAERLPAELRDANPTGKLWRLIGEGWTQDNVGMA